MLVIDMTSDAVDDCNYLGTVFHYTERIVGKSLKALIVLLNKCKGYVVFIHALRMIRGGSTMLVIDMTSDAVDDCNYLGTVFHYTDFF